LKYPSTLFVCNTPCGLARHMDLQYPDIAKHFWGKTSVWQKAKFIIFISFIGHTYKRLHIITQTKKITGYTSNGASANGTTRPMQGATPIVSMMNVMCMYMLQNWQQYNHLTFFKSFVTKMNIVSLLNI
jgi:hypothetical protein